MLCCPVRSPRSRSNRLPGGTASSWSSRARFSWSSFRRATDQSTCGQDRRAAAVSDPSKMFSVPRSRKERITCYIITAIDITAKRSPSALRPDMRISEFASWVSRLRRDPGIDRPGAGFGQHRESANEGGPGRGEDSPVDSAEADVATPHHDMLRDAGRSFRRECGRASRRGPRGMAPHFFIVSDMEIPSVQFFSSEKLISQWEPSQKGLFLEAPHRHSVQCSSEAPSPRGWSLSSIPPVT